jgi:hypothetical protein
MPLTSRSWRPTPVQPPSSSPPTATAFAPAQIAKTLSLRIKDRTLLVVASGTARLNNRKVKDVLGGKPRMLTADEVVAATGHPVGGRLPVRTGDAAAGLLRSVAQGFRRGGAGGRLHPLRAPHQPGPDGRTREGGMGRRV